MLNGTVLSPKTNPLPLEVLYGLLVRDFGQTSLFKTSVEPDDKASDQFALIVTQINRLKALVIY